MARLTLVFSLLFFLLSGNVLAGSSIFQPALRARNQTNTLGRRYFHATKDRRIGTRVPWPNKRIRYCFSPDELTQANKRRIKAHLKDAHKLWISKGLSDTFHIEEVNDSVCTNDRNNVLMVTYTGNSATSGMGTYVGFPDESVKMLPDTGPGMRLTDRTNMGMLDVVANYAHELGHAWGLFHEHQNPAFWSGVLGSDAGEVFGPEMPGGWNCHNLIDYQEKVVGVLVVQGAGRTQHIGRERLCQSQNLASQARFSAHDYLPTPNMGTSHSTGHGEHHVDWDSLMLYPSGAGAVELGYNDDPQNPDTRARILQKPDGSRIRINKFPSALDIAAMNSFYEHETPLKLNLLNSIIGFKKVYTASNSGPSGGSGCL